MSALKAQPLLRPVVRTASKRHSHARQPGFENVEPRIMLDVSALSAIRARLIAFQDFEESELKVNAQSRAAVPTQLARLQAQQPSGLVQTGSAARVALAGTLRRPVRPKLPPARQVDSATLIPGQPGTQTRATFELSQRLARFRNEVGLYLVDDAAGSIGDLKPGDKGYAKAAIERRVVLFKQGDKAGTATQVELPGGGYFATYLISNSSSSKFLSRNPSNLGGRRPLAFFTFRAANPDRFGHVRLTAEGLQAWEDLPHGGDRDFNDAVIRVGYDPTDPDLIPPLVMIQRPPDGLVTNQNLVVAGLAVDEGSGVAVVEARITSDSAGLASISTAPDLIRVPFDPATGQFQLPMNFQRDGSDDGHYVAEVRAHDHASNVSPFIPVGFTFDSQPPTVALTNPEPGICTSDLPVFSGRVSDNLSGVASLQVQVDSDAFQPVPFDNAGQFQFATSGLSDGLHTLGFRATDAAANQSAVVERSFTLDTTAPVIEITEPTVTLTTNVNITIKGRVTDNLCGVAALTARVDSGMPVSVTYNGDGFFEFTTAFALDGSGDGPHSITFDAIDQVGNDAADVPVTLLLDATAPVVIITSPQDDQLGTTNITIVGRVTDNLSGVETLGARLDSGSIVDTTFDELTGDFSFATELPLDGTADGRHRIDFQATDFAGNVSQLTSLSFRLDTVAPIVQITAPSDGLKTRSNPTIEGLVTDNYSGVKDLFAWVDTSAPSPVVFDSDGLFSHLLGLPTDGTADGSHSVTFQAEDEAGHSSDPISLTFVLDTQPPQITLTSPPQDLLTRQNVTIEGMVQDITTSVALLEAQVDAGSFTPVPFDPATGLFSLLSILRLDGTDDGGHTIRFRATDEVDNTSRLLPYDFTLDTTPPPLTLVLDPDSDTAPVGDDQTTLAEVILVGQTEPGLKVTLLQTGAMVMSDQSGAYAFPGVPLAPGDNNFRVETADAAGNSSAAERTIVRDEAGCVFNDLTGWVITEMGGSPGWRGLRRRRRRPRRVARRGLVHCHARTVVRHACRGDLARVQVRGSQLRYVGPELDQRRVRGGAGRCRGPEPGLHDRCWPRCVLQHHGGGNSCARHGYDLRCGDGHRDGRRERRLRRHYGHADPPAGQQRSRHADGGGDHVRQCAGGTAGVTSFAESATAGDARTATRSIAAGPLPLLGAVGEPARPVISTTLSAPTSGPSVENLLGGLPHRL